MKTATGCIKVDLGGQSVLVHRITGKPIKLVLDKVIRGSFTCDECGERHKWSHRYMRLSKRYKPENIIRREIEPPTRCYIPIYEE